VLTGEGLVVFPSNAQLSLRAHGMPASTLRRHLAALVDSGVVIRRDSPNGKRYARRDRLGELEKAFGFDLSPLVARAAEFEALAEGVRAQERALRYARERITLARRDIAKMIATGFEEAVPIPANGRGASDWPAFHAQYRSLVEAIPRNGAQAELEGIAGELCGLAAYMLNILENHVIQRQTSSNESQSERHIQSSNSQIFIEPESSIDNSKASLTVALQPLAKAKNEAAFPLGFVLQACPDIADYARDGVTHWRDLVAAASVARAAVGVSPSAWEAAISAMGERNAAIVVAAILQRGPAISSAGGYLRELTRKAQAGEFSLGRMLMALIGARDREKKRA
jgi:replication initiation protein RepC